MAETTYFPSSNNYHLKKQDSTDRTKSNPLDGFCVAASALWCSNILKGKKPQNSKPCIARAGMLQSLYRRGGVAAQGGVLKVLSRVNITGHAYKTVTRLQAINRMGVNPGLYYCEGSRHAFAVDTRVGHFYFYDIASGLYGYGTLAEWETGIKARVPVAVANWFYIRC